MGAHNEAWILLERPRVLTRTGATWRGPILTALVWLNVGCRTCMYDHNALRYWLCVCSWDNTSDLKYLFMCISASGVMGEMDNSVTSGKATVKRDLVLAPGRQGEAVCPLNALLQSQQPHANSLSPGCRRLCSVAWLPVRLPATPHTCYAADSDPCAHSALLWPMDRKCSAPRQ